MATTKRCMVINMKNDKRQVTDSWVAHCMHPDGKVENVPVKHIVGNKPETPSHVNTKEPYQIRSKYWTKSWYRYRVYIGILEENDQKLLQSISTHRVSWPRLDPRDSDMATDYDQDGNITMKPKKIVPNMTKGQLEKVKDNALSQSNKKMASFVQGVKRQTDSPNTKQSSKKRKGCEAVSAKTSGAVPSSVSASESVLKSDASSATDLAQPSEDSSSEKNLPNGSKPSTETFEHILPCGSKSLSNDNTSFLVEQDVLSGTFDPSSSISIPLDDSLNDLILSAFNNQSDTASQGTTVLVEPTQSANELQTPNLPKQMSYDSGFVSKSATSVDDQSHLDEVARLKEELRFYKTLAESDSLKKQVGLLMTEFSSLKQTVTSKLCNFTDRIDGLENSFTSHFCSSVPSRTERGSMSVCSEILRTAPYAVNVECSKNGDKVHLGQGVWVSTTAYHTLQTTNCQDSWLRAFLLGHFGTIKEATKYRTRLVKDGEGEKVFPESLLSVGTVLFEKFLNRSVAIRTARLAKKKEKKPNCKEVLADKDDFPRLLSVKARDLNGRRNKPQAPSSSLGSQPKSEASAPSAGSREELSSLGSEQKGVHSYSPDKENVDMLGSPASSHDEDPVVEELLDNFGNPQGSPCSSVSE